MNKQATLMIVEDERIVALDLRTQLQALGYRISRVVASGEAAVRDAIADRPDLVLMDIHLEGRMDGIDAAREIQLRLKIPVIFLTAYTEDETLARALGSTPFGYLVKPCDGRELHATVQMALARREVEMTVENNEARLTLALDVGKLGVVEWLPETKRLRGAGHLGVLAGSKSMPMEESCDAFLSRVHADDRAYTLAAINSTLSTNASVDILFRTAGEGDQVRQIEARAKAYPDPQGSSSRIISVLLDVTERRRDEDRLRQSSVVFETTSEAVIIADTELRAVAVNAAFRRITGYVAHDVLGQRAIDLLQTSLNVDAVFALLNSGTTEFWQGEVVCKRKGGETFPSWQNISAVRGPTGSITHYVLAFSDISDIHRAEQQLEHLAHHDTLTGLPNRLLFEDRFDHALQIAQRNGHRCHLLFIDLDDFKSINDTLGHTTGDRLLQMVAARLKSALRRSDTIARLGGDEFVVIAESADVDDGVNLAEKLIDALALPVTIDNDRIAVTCSIGISQYPEHGDDRHILMRTADIAMYAAKSGGRNGYRLYTFDMAERAIERMQIEQGLKRAIDGEGLAVHYQPQVSLADGRILGVEALARWPHPELGMIPPSRFIPVAEESGVINALGRWVLRRACRDLVGVCGPDGTQLRLAVNVSARQFARDDLITTVQAVLAETGFPAASLELEVTESCLQITERSIAILDSLKALGITVSIDDFGTGYSSLSALRNLPIDRLKVDRSFIADIHRQPDSVTVVYAICTLAKSLRMAVVVEGIEYLEQAQLLQTLGCEEGQGYLFCHPLPLLELLNRMDASRGVFGAPGAVRD